MAVKKKSVKSKPNHAGIPPAVARLFANMESNMEAQFALIQQQLAQLQGGGEAQNAERKAQSAAQQEKSARIAAREAQIAALKTQLAAQQEKSAQIERKIAQLQEAAPASGAKPHVAGLKSAIAPQASSLKPQAFPQARTQLAKPVITSVFAINPTTIVINWLPVEGAESYNLRIGTNEDVTPYLLNTTCSASAISLTLSGLDPNTQYWVSMRTHAVSPDTNSNYTYFGPVTTPSATQPGTVGDLNQWWNGIQALTENAGVDLQQTDGLTLTPEQRRRLLGSGVRRYGFIDKTSDLSGQFPQFWPAAVCDTNGDVALHDTIKDRLREIETLRGILAWLRWLTRAVQDKLMLAGDDAFRIAGIYYASVRAAARSNLPEAQQVFEMLEMFWRARRRPTGEPTQRKAIRDAKGLMNGTKTGTVAFTNEGERIVKGVKSIVDETQSARQHGGMRVAETERVE